MNPIECESCGGSFAPGEMAYPASIGIWHPRCIPCENRREENSPRKLDRGAIHEHYVRWLLREYRQLCTKEDIWDARRGEEIENHIVSLATDIEEQYLIGGAQ